MYQRPRVVSSTHVFGVSDAIETAVVSRCQPPEQQHRQKPPWSMRFRASRWSHLCLSGLPSQSPDQPGKLTDTFACGARAPAASAREIVSKNVEHAYFPSLSHATGKSNVLRSCAPRARACWTRRTHLSSSRTHRTCQTQVKGSHGASLTIEDRRISGGCSFAAFSTKQLKDRT